MELSAATVAALAAQPPSVACILERVMVRLAFSLERGFSSGEIAKLCTYLSRSIDITLYFNDVPVIAHGLPSLLKQVYQRRNDGSFQLEAAITVLMLSVKKACKNGWFHTAENEGLLNMANELCSSFCMTANTIADVSDVLGIISNIIPRFCPQLKLCSLIASFEAKPGYDCLMADFDCKRNLPPEEKIMLLVIERDKLQTSSCLITPAEVSFLVNGRGVERRTNVSLDNGPQFPTDITSMANNGANAIQAIGCFRGNYIIAIAFMSKFAPTVPILNEYIQPIVDVSAPDSEIIEGASRVSLNCPFSFKRIKTPVKGHLCKHLQCFDYENFIEMNLRKPSWHCPCCNQPASCIDVCIDKKMVKILCEVGDNINDVVISADGTWKVVEHNNSTCQQNMGYVECVPNGSLNSFPNYIDLSMEDGRTRRSDAAMRYREVENLDGASNRENNVTWDAEDHKPFSCIPMTTEGSSYQMIDGTCPMTWSSVSPSNRPLVSTVQSDAHRVGTLESLIPNSVLNPVITSAPLPTPNCEPTVSEVSPPNFSTQSIVRQLPENMQLQQPLTRSLIISNETVRRPVFRNFNLAPIAVQPLAAQSQVTNATQCTNSDILVSSSHILGDFLSVPYQTIPTMAVQDGYSTAGGDIEMPQASETSGTVAPLHQLQVITQNRDHQDDRHILNPALQGVGLGTRALSNQQRGAGAYRASLQPPADHMTSHHHQLDLRTHQTMNQCTSSLPQTGVSLSQFQQASQNAASSAVKSLVNQHNQISIARYTSQLGREQPLVHPHTAFITGSPFPVTDGFSQRGGRVSNMVGGAPISDGATQLPSEERWQPTGRMRGSLTGNAYSAALSHYLAQSNMQMTTRSQI